MTEYPVFYAGVLGSLILVLGAAWPEKKHIRPMHSWKNRLFAIGSFLMFAYAFLGYLNGGSIFFVILEMFILVANVLMMLDIDDRIDFIILSLIGILLVTWSLFLFQGYATVLFVFGLSVLGLGYAFKTGSVRRNAALTAGSIFIVIFSYFEKNWIFFWVNTFFACFSAYYLLYSPRKIRQ